MSKPNLGTAALRLASNEQGNKVGEFNPAVWLPFIMAVLDRLIACRPNPEDGYDYLAWRPWRILDPFGWRLAEHRRRAMSVMAFKWDGDLEAGKAAAETVFAAIDAGRIDRQLFTGCWEERGRRARR